MKSYKIKNDNDQLDDDDFTALFNPKKKPYTQFDHIFSAKQTHIYISEEIIEPENYIDMIHTLNIADPNDVIYIHLNTNGGQLDTGVQIINAMQNSAASIITVLEGMAHSLGTLIFLSGDEMVVNDNCMMMFHNWRGGVVGKGNELTSELDATIKWFAALAKRIYIPFMSEDEVKSLIKGEDIWMDSKEIKKRLARIEKKMVDDFERKEIEKLEKSTKPKTTRKSKAAQPVDQTTTTE